MDESADKAKLQYEKYRKELKAVEAKHEDELKDLKREVQELLNDKNVI